MKWTKLQVSIIGAGQAGSNIVSDQEQGHPSANTAFGKVLKVARMLMQ
jgi:hypothetical protein